MNFSKKAFLALSVAGMMVGSVALAAYPTKQITVLQGFKAGGGSDTLAQLTQPYLEKILGKSMVNQYIPGATGAIAWTQLAKTARKDGYTLSITNTPMLLTNYIMTPSVTYNVDELTPIANIITDPGIVVVAADSPFKTFEDFMTAIKGNPGKVTVGNSGVGGDDFFTTLIFEKAAGVKVQMVPFEGDGPSWQAAMGNKVDVSFNNVGIVYPQIKAGNLRALAIMAEKRYELLPDVPTMREKGIDVVSGSSRGYSAPAGIPAEARQTLIDAFKKMAENPDFIKGCADRASIIDMKYGDDYKAMLKNQEKAFTEIWNEVKDQFQKH
ncbi:MAG: Bug family tripartite tricarboxylate transporter substrate binding protein [Pyramidobacter sp.]|jgi:putative tricarboxylic transport membrane protein